MSLKKNIQVMVVDDMTVSRGLIEQALDEIGVVNVQYESDPALALRKLAANPVHLVLSDYYMPTMSGIGLLEALRANRSTLRIGFILITGRPDKEIIAQGQKHGMNNFLVKPFSTQQLRACIEKVVGPLG